MKKLILILIIEVFILNVNAQELKAKDIPLAVADTFYNTHPLIKNVDWSKNGNNYQAKYDIHRKDITVTYDEAGKLIQTEEEIDVAALPPPIIQYVKENYGSHRIKEAYKITDAAGMIRYEAEVKNVDLIFDSGCNFVETAQQ